jgi:hypothetical protein
LSLDEKLKERKVAVPPMKDRKNWIRFTLGEVESTTNRAENNNITSNNQENDEEMLMKKRKLEIASNLGIELSNESTPVSQSPQGRNDHNKSENYEDGEEEEDADENSVLSMELADEEEQEQDQQQQWQGEINHSPTIPLLLQFDQVLAQRLLEHLIEWFSETHHLHVKLLPWIYSLLARVEKPLHREIVGLIRELYRTCCNLRSSLDKNKNPNFERDLAQLNLLITITGYYFGQSEDCSKISLPTEEEEMKRKAKESGKQSESDQGKETFSIHDLMEGSDGEEEDDEDEEEGDEASDGEVCES